MKALITGGAGFIGSNLAHRLIGENQQVTVYDDLSRLGTDKNVAWLCAEHGENWTLLQADIRDFEALRSATEDADIIYHLASQVAVTTSVQDPRHDFEVNALGTFNYYFPDSVCTYQTGGCVGNPLASETYTCCSV